jgi:hypothetical protein
MEWGDGEGNDNGGSEWIDINAEIYEKRMLYA